MNTASGTMRRVREIGKRAWKTESGYDKRSLVEMSIYRHKRTFGERLDARKVENQVTEATIRANMLNTMLQAARPKSVPAT